MTLSSQKQNYTVFSIFLSIMTIINGFECKILACIIELIQIHTYIYTSLKSVFFSWSVFFPQATEYTIGAYGKFNAGVPDTGGNGKLPPVSLTPVANLAPTSRTPAVPVKKFATCVLKTGGKLITCVGDTGGKFAAGVVETGGNLKQYISGHCHFKISKESVQDWDCPFITCLSHLQQLLHVLRGKGCIRLTLGWSGQWQCEQDNLFGARKYNAKTTNNIQLIFNVFVLSLLLNKDDKIVLNSLAFVYLLRNCWATEFSFYCFTCSVKSPKLDWILFNSEYVSQKCVTYWINLTQLFIKNIAE